MPAPNPMEKLLRRKKMDRHHVAIVFTDIEDSTPQGIAKGDPEWAVLRDEHFEIAKRCLRSNRGVLVKTVGDSVIAVFEHASPAAKFALDFLDKLRSWNSSMKVRIGIHAGVIDIGKGDIFGTEVNRAARVEAAAAGGQVLATAGVRQAVNNARPSWLTKAEWLDRGRKELKGFVEPEQLWELRPRDGPVRDAELEAAVAKYSKKLLTEEFRLLNLLGFPELKERPQIELPRVFVMPRVMPSVGMRDVDREKKKPSASKVFLGSGKALVFLGTPGSGKTTLLRYFGRACLEKLPDLNIKGRYVPAYFPVRHLDKSGMPLKKTADLWTYLAHYCDEELDFKVPKGFFEKLATQGKILLLVDGLDEVATEDRRRDVVAATARITADLPSGNRVVVTSRIAGYGKTPLPQDFAHCDIRDFDEKEIQEFLLRWYKQRQPKAKKAKEDATELWKAMENSGIREMAGNPLILTMIALIHQVETKLPEGRALLYDKCTECLLDLWKAKLPKIPDLSDFDLYNKRKVLGRVTYQAQLEASEEARKTGLVMDEQWLLKQFCLFLKKDFPMVKAGHVAKLLLDALKERDGVLAEVQPGHFGYLHKTFQEYFAAWHIGETISTPQDALVYLKKHIDDPFWQETLVLAIARKTGSLPTLVLEEMLLEGRVAFAWECLQSGARVDTWLSSLIRFLYQCFQPFRGEVPSLEAYLPTWRDRVMPILIGLFANRDGRVLYPALQLLEALAENGNEAAVTLLAGFLSEYSSAQDDMVQVQAGPFTMGDTFGDGYENEKPVTEMNPPSFRIDRFPVTNAEYEKMIPAHSNERTEYSKEPRQPVVNISWWEAALYCKWSGARLPSEAEWEKAASWDPEKKQKRKYPWDGDWDPSKCNWWEKGPRTTTPRGRYPEGLSAYQCEDMAGNVWEWTSDDYRKYPYEMGLEKPPFSRDARVVRGGSFDYAGPRYLRCSCRYWTGPVYRNYFIGFRRARTK